MNKKILLLAVCNLIAVCSFAQARNNSLLRNTTTKQQLDRAVAPEETKKEYSYDSYGNLLSETTYSWRSGAWEGSYKIEYTYNANQKPLTETHYNSSGNSWVESNKTVFEYDTNGKLKKTTELAKDSNPIDGWDWKSEYEFDENERQKTGAIYTRNSSNEEWSVSEKYKYEWEYDTEGKPKKATEFSWDFTNEAWINDWKFEYTYHTNGNPATETSYEYDPASGWETDMKFEYTYDSKGNLKSETIYNYWTADIYKNEFEYDLSVSSGDCIFPPLSAGESSVLEISIANKMTKRIRYNLVNGNWVERATFTFEYSNSDISGISDVPQSEISIFPNPVAESLHIKGIETETPLTIWDMNGKAVIQKVVSSDEVISVSHLASGMYFVKTENQTIKIIKQ